MLFYLVKCLQPIAGLLIHDFVLHSRQDLLVLVLRAYSSDRHHEETTALLLDGCLRLNLAAMAPMTFGRG